MTQMKEEVAISADSWDPEKHYRPMCMKCVESVPKCLFTKFFQAQWQQKQQKQKLVEKTQDWKQDPILRVFSYNWAS